jgi:Subtilase family
MSKKSVSCLTCVCVLLICSYLFADAGKAFKAMRKVELKEEPSAPITTVPITFGDEEKELLCPPGPVNMIEPNLIKLKSRYFLPDKTWQPEEFTGTRHIYVKLDSTNPKSEPSLLERTGFNVNNILRDCLYVIETDFKGIEKLKQKKYVTGIEPILLEDKMCEEVYRGNYCNQAFEVDGNVLLNVSFFDAVDYQEASQIVYQVGGRVISEQMLQSNIVVISISPTNIKTLAISDRIRYISNLSPPQIVNSVNSGIAANVFWWDTYPDTYTGLFDSPYFYTGTGIKVGVRDGGTVFAHSKFGNRLTIVDDPDTALHATKVAGIIAASAFIYNGKLGGGMAEAVDIYSYSVVDDGDGPSNTSDFTDGLNDSGIRIYNNSYGRDVGVSYNNTYYFGQYSTSAEGWDDVVYNYYDEFLCLVKSAGNDRWEGDSETSFDGVEAPDGEAYHCIPDLACAKNIITVGAVEWSDTDTDGIVDFADSEISLSMWPAAGTWKGKGSSTGPTDDGRIKPDLVAVGTDVWTTSVSDGQDSYNTSWGTSMAAPAVTGIVALLHEAYDEVYGDWPTADVVKAILCNTAVDLGRTGPDFLYGWGLADAKAAIDTILNDVDGISANGGYISYGIIEHYDDEVTFQIEVDSNNDTSDLKVTLVWVDPEGDPNATYALINDLDLEVIDPNEAENETTYYPWVMQGLPDPDPEVDYDTETWKPHLLAEQSTFNPGGNPSVKNVLDNIEQVVIAADTTAALDTGTWTVKVRGGSISSDHQPFAVVSNKGFSGVNFLNCKVLDVDTWVTPRSYTPNTTPDLRFAVFSKNGIDLEDGNNPPQYAYSTNGGSSWTDWSNLGDDGGCYSDVSCSISLDGEDINVGITYIRIDEIPFNQTSYDENLVKVRVYRDSYVEKEYTIPIGTVGYVDADEGSDTSSSGTKDSPWKTISYALDKISADADHPFTLRLRGTNTDTGMQYAGMEMIPYVDIVGGFNENWMPDESYISCINDTQSISAVVAASNCTISKVTVKSDTATFGLYVSGET